MTEFAKFIIDTIGGFGYIGIFILMLLESTFIPVPSEIVMIPAGYLASTGGMDFTLALIIGTFGATCGATINYILGFYLGEKVIKKLIKHYGKYLLIQPKHFDKTEKYFERHGGITTFIGRFIAVVRHLISIPAGIFKMNFTKFFVYTIFGAGLWNLTLMTIGYVAGENKELIAKYSEKTTYLLIIILIGIGIVYYYRNEKKIALEDLEK